jgi:hypothetical protein
MVTPKKFATRHFKVISTSKVLTNSVLYNTLLVRSGVLYCIDTVRLKWFFYKYGIPVLIGVIRYPCTFASKRLIEDTDSLFS